MKVTFRYTCNIRVEIPGETLCPHILLVQTSGLGMVCYKLKIHLQKATTTKWKTRGGWHQHKLATKCHAQGFFCQHVIYSFVAGHFVATKLQRSKTGCPLLCCRSLCSYSICSVKGFHMVFFLSTCHLQKPQNVSPGQKKNTLLQKCFLVFRLSHIIQKRQLQNENGCPA